MTKTELVKHIADAAGITQGQATKALDSTIDGIATGLRNGDSVALQGLGTFKMVHREARTGRNPSTGATIQIPAKDVLKFKASKNADRLIKGF